jgi:mono/diheme cytochrome c family protein
MVTRTLLRAGVALVLVLSLSFLRPASPTAAQGPDAEELLRGLVATYSDGTTITRIEPTVALSLKAGEAPHPRLKADGGKYEWHGFLNLLRGGKYRFSAQLVGSVSVKVGTSVVFKADAAALEMKEGAEVELAAGVLPLTVEYQRPAGAARLELLWQGPGFRREPLPPDFVGHVPPKGGNPAVTQAAEDRGRYLFEEHSCIKCHASDGNKLAAGLGSRSGPDLSKVGGRVHPGWIEKWLEAPQALQHDAVMPELFARDEAGKAERYAVAKYLGTLGGKVPDSPAVPAKEASSRASKGEKVYHSVGCVVCHGTYPASGITVGEVKTFYGATTQYPLTGLGSKTTPEKLAEFLSNPLAVNPAGRMPHMLLSGEEARDIAWFLAQSTVPGLTKTLPQAPGKPALEAAFKQVDPRADELAAWKKLGDEAQLLDLGKRSVIARGCNNCHKIEPDGKPFASVQASDLSHIAPDDIRERGCLTGAAAGKHPRFQLSAKEREQIAAFLRTGLKGAGSPAPAYQARVAIERFNCLACHTKDTEGGLTTALLETLRKYERVENSEALLPPSLNGVGHKLRTSAVRGVLLQSVRVRQWMGLRMPQFGEANVGGLVEGLATLEGTAPDDTLHKVELSSAKLKAGRDLAGKGAFGCSSCHDMASVPNVGTRGPDLSLTPARVRYDWYLRWLEQPQRMQQGTRMPAVFTGGKSLVDRVFDGHADRQAEAMWAYFSLGSNMPLPEGMESPKGMTLAVTDRPILLRTFMPDAGSRSLALGFPGGVSATFDAQVCRLAYAWSGNFLDVSPVWANRGGAPAKVLGPRFWSAPAGCPVGLTEGDDPPDFASRVKDPAYGANLPEGQLYQGERHLRFGGYATSKTGEPTFRYEIDGAGKTVKVAELIKGERAAAGLGLQRTFTLEAPKGRTAWVLLAEGPQEPQLVQEAGRGKKLDLASGKAEFPVKDGALLLPLDAERAQVLRVTGADAIFRIQKLGATWQILAHVAGNDAVRTLEVRLWQPYRNDPKLIEEVLAGK